LQKRWESSFSPNSEGSTEIREALAIDERRRSYGPNIWAQSQPIQDIKQVWFAGVHADVAGGYPDQESGLSKISLEWMLNEAAESGLLFSQEAVAFILGRTGKIVRKRLASDLAEVEERIVEHVYPVGPDPAAVMHRSLVGLSRLLGFAKMRWIPEGARVHESVFIRMERVSSYKPKNLPNQYTIESARYRPEPPWLFSRSEWTPPKKYSFDSLVEASAATHSSSALAVANLVQSRILQQRVQVRTPDGLTREFRSVWDIPEELSMQLTTESVSISFAPRVSSRHELREFS
jgi:hypothetical protein